MDSMDTHALPKVKPHGNTFQSEHRVFDWDAMNWEPWTTEEIQLPPPNAERPPPPFNFNREKLTLEIRLGGDAFDLDLAAITTKASELRFRTPDGKDYTPSKQWRQEYGLRLRDEIEAAAWATFTGKRFHRSLILGEHAHDFDVFEAVQAGATLDWELGAVQWPSEKQLLKCATPIFEVESASESEDLITTRYLCRGGAAVFTGPTGVGKSSLVMQLAIDWALGETCLGFEPSRPLATLFIQAENDAGDVEEQRDGIFEGLQLDEQDEAVVNEMVAVATVDDVSGRDFFGRLKKLIRDWQPDLIVLDPLLAYVGGDLNRQEVAADFLRHRLNPLLHRAGVAAIIVHHTGKPPRDPRDQGGNPDYAGLGSSELSNWARAICSLTVEGDAFCLTLGKRGKRAGITDEMGVTRVWLRHAQNRIFWEPAAAATVASPKKAKTAEDLIALVPVSPGRVLKKSLLEKAQAAGIGTKKSAAFLDELIDAARLHIHREKRPGTNPLQYIARHPLEPQIELPQ